MAISVVVAVGDVADPLVSRDPRAAAEDQGRARAPTPSSEMGPLVTREHRDKVASYLDSGADQGADGRRRRPRASALPRRPTGFFLGVSLIDHVTPEMDCYRDEIFGPVLEVVRVADVRRGGRSSINDNPYGNGTAIFTRDGGAARQFQFDVNVGMVGINVPIPVPVAYYSFGGWKTRCSATCTCTARRASSSTPGPRSSRRAGPTRGPRRSISASRAPGRPMQATRSRRADARSAGEAG